MSRNALVVPSARQLSTFSEANVLTLVEFNSPARALIAMPVRPAARHVVWVIASLVFLSLGLIAVVPVDSVVTAPGRVVSLAATHVVQPLETSIIREINVKEGDAVKAGDVLARLDSTFSGADTDALQAQVASFQAEIDRLSAEAQDHPYAADAKNSAASVQSAIYAARQSQYKFQMESFTQKISGLTSLVTQAESDVAAYRQRLAIAVELEGKRRDLELQRFGSVMNRMAAQDQRIEIERTLADAVSTVQKAGRDLQQTTADRDAFRQQWKEQISQDLNQRQRSLSDATEGLRKATLRHQLVVLRAEQDSVVLSVAKVSLGSVVQSGDQLLTLMPDNAPLTIDARVEATEAGLVQTQRTVVLKFDAFPYVRFGSGDGTVRTVSADSFTTIADEMQHGAGAGQAQQTAPYYKVRISVDALNLHDVPGGFKLKAGMPVTADIKLGRRTVLSYLLDRVLPVSMEGMRER